MCRWRHRPCDWQHHRLPYRYPLTFFSLSVALATSYSFNRTLVHKVAEYTADEVRGKHNDYVKRTASSSLSIPLEGIYKVHAGITCWTPVVNIFRHPLWGRGQETYFSCLNL